MALQRSWRVAGVSSARAGRARRKKRRPARGRRAEKRRSGFKFKFKF